jgi:two-component sensor histidine kinase/CheY-like chemotaxis protein
MTETLKVLIVEDSIADAELMVHELRRVGYDPAWRVVADEAQLRGELRDRPHIILSDFNLPSFNAMEALRILIECGVEVPFIVVTGSVGEEAAVELIKQGAADYLLKDRLARLGEAVRAALDKQRMRDEARETETAIRRFGETQRTLLLELDHRVRNNLASLLALVDITRDSTANVQDFAQSIGGRVRAMAQIHGLLSHAQWRSLDLKRLIETIAPPQSLRQLRLDGPPVEVPARQVTALGMVLHELMANSLKHGALAARAGRVDVTWRRSGIAGADQYTMQWTEQDGKPIAGVPTAGTGTELMLGLTRSELDGEATLSYPQHGADHRFVVRFDRDPQSEQGEPDSGSFAGNRGDDALPGT